MIAINPKVFGLLGTVLLIASPASSEEVMYVQASKVILKKEPKIFASKVLALRYGQQVTVLSEEDGWKLARVKKKQGYLPATALREKAIEPKGSGNYEPSKTDVDLSAKGLSDIEADLKSNHRELRYDLVDKMERRKLSVESVKKFMRQANLNVGR